MVCVKPSRIGQGVIVAFDGNAENNLCDGIISQVQWNNPAVMEALRVLFSCTKTESIEAIEISVNGIHAKFNRT